MTPLLSSLLPYLCFPTLNLIASSPLIIIVTYVCVFHKSAGIGCWVCFCCLCVYGFKADHSALDNQQGDSFYISSLNVFFLFDHIYNLFLNHSQIQVPSVSIQLYVFKKIIVQVQFLLSKYGLSLEAGQLTRGYILRENHLFLSQQLIIANIPTVGHGNVCPTPLLTLRFHLAWACMGFVCATATVVSS